MTEPSTDRGTVFLSYSREDRARVELLVTALERQGFDVWWDREIPHGQNFNRAIEAALSQARCAIVVWSQASITSEWVFNEASESRRRQILVPVLIDNVEPPLEFRHLQASRLVDWTGDLSDEEWSGLLAAVRTLVGRGRDAAVPAASRPVVEPRRRHWWQTPAGGAAGGGALLLGAALLLMAVNQLGVFGGRLAPSESSTTATTPGVPGASSVGTPRTSAPERTPGIQSGGAESGPAAVATTGRPNRVNLLDPAHGGKLVAASQEQWRQVVDAQPSTATLAAGGFAVFAFQGERPALVDAISVFVESTNALNVRTLALSASDRSENGPFTEIGTVTVPNYRNMRDNGHELPLQPFSARYVRITLIEWQDAPGYPSGYLGDVQLLGTLQ